MLVACEVGVEFYLSMVHSPQIRWMQQTDEAWPLQVGACAVGGNLVLWVGGCWEK